MKRKLFSVAKKNWPAACFSVAGGLFYGFVVTELLAKLFGVSANKWCLLVACPVSFVYVAWTWPKIPRAIETISYDLHLTRREYWSEEGGEEITFEEWISYVRNDVEIQPNLANPGRENWMLVLATESWPLWWHHSGEIVTELRGGIVLEKLISVATALNARVVGDDEEIYSIDHSGAISVQER